MLRVVMDSAGDIPEAWLMEYKINIIPVNIQFKEETYLQGVNLTDEEFYSKVEREGTIPKTSQPSPHQFMEFYQKIADVGDTILSMHVTSKLSGTYESAVIAARELKDKFNIIPFDSGCGSAGIGFMCKEARVLERLGVKIDNIIEKMSEMRKNMVIVLTLDTLEYARMSGRVNALKAKLTSILNIKPIVFLKEGTLELGGQVRTRKKALESVVDSIRKRVNSKLVNVAVVHAIDPVAASNLIKMVKEKLNCNEVILTSLSAGVAANLGPGTVGVVAYPVD